MVKYSDAEFVAFRKRKSSKKVLREAGAVFGVGISPDGEVPSAAPITNMIEAKVEAHASLSEVPGETKAARELVEASGAAEGADGAEAAIGENALV